MVVDNQALLFAILANFYLSRHQSIEADHLFTLSEPLDMQFKRVVNDSCRETTLTATQFMHLLKQDQVMSVFIFWRYHYLRAEWFPEIQLNRATSERDLNTMIYTFDFHGRDPLFQYQCTLRQGALMMPQRRLIERELETALTQHISFFSAASDLQSRQFFVRLSLALHLSHFRELPDSYQCEPYHWLPIHLVRTLYVAESALSYDIRNSEYRFQVPSSSINYHDFLGAKLNRLCRQVREVCIQEIASRLACCTQLQNGAA